MTEPTSEDPELMLQREVQRCWPLAQQHWSRFLLLADPVDDPLQDSVAQIHLGTRQVSFNGAMLREKNLLGSVEAILAHEIGHHVRYPGSLAVQARMRIMERSLLPFEDYSLINLFTDLMINEKLGKALKEQMIAVYQAFTSEPAFHSGEEHWKRDPSFLFYLSIYEELWRVMPGSIMGPAYRGFHQAFPTYRSEAQLLVQNLFTLGPNLYTQFLYFLSILCRYIKPLIKEQPEQGGPYQCSCASPTDGDWADAITPTAKELEAIRRALQEGWFNESAARRLKQVEDIEERIANLPGFGTADAQRVPDIMAAYYRQQAEIYLFRPPPQKKLGEAVVPTTLEEWEAGDAVREIDWLATLSQFGELLGPAQPLKRVRIAEYEGQDVNLWQPRMEIYLDVSGSMPDPRRAVNAMTLAAQILTMGTIRAGGWVRSLLYSSEPVLYWEWCRSEVEMSKFLMHYIGGGTNFPFPLLDRSVGECEQDQPIRVVISDTDFDWNYNAEPYQRQNRRILTDAVDRSPHFILLQHLPSPDSIAHYRQLGATVIEVREMEDFPRLAADLTFALFPDQAGL